MILQAEREADLDPSEASAAAKLVAKQALKQVSCMQLVCLEAQ